MVDALTIADGDYVMLADQDEDLRHVGDLAALLCQTTR